MNQKTNAPVEFVAMGYCSNDYLCRVPQIPIDHKVEIIEHQIQGGGPAADAAVAAARLGLRTMFVTSVGNDDGGKRILADLAREGIDTSRIPVREGCGSPMAYCWIDSDGKRSVAWTHNGLRLLTAEEVPYDVIAGAKMLHLDGHHPEAALAAPAHLGGFDGVFAPFGDIYLTELEFLARMRNRAGEAVPSRLVTLNAVEHTLEEILARAMTPSWDDTDWSAYIAQTLSQLEPAQVDGVLEAHVDRMKPFEELPLAATQREATALLLMLVRQGEYARRMLPSTPIVSGRSFSERCWPTSLAWSDLGKHGEEAKTIAGLVQAEVDRLSERGEDMGERMRDEVMGFIGGMLGLTQEQLDELRSEEGRRKIQENLKQFEEQVQDVINRMVGEDSHSASAQQGKRPPFPPGKMPSGHGFPFFSDN